MRYTVYGTPSSLYSGKVFSYLRKQGVDFAESSPGSDRFLTHIMPAIGRWIIPVMETPHGQIIQDGADIIDYFENGAGASEARHPSYPDDPVLLAISHLFELFGGEGLLRPAMHYRWNFDERNLSFLREEFALNFPANLTAEQAGAAFDKASGRMRRAATIFGVSDDTGPTIEASFHEWLDLFSAHLEDRPYLLGNRPTLGDYCLMGPMWAHLYRDPAPTALIKDRAPKVGRWVERMSTYTPHHHEYPTSGDELVDAGNLPESLLAMMRFIAQEYLPEIEAHITYANGWLAARPDLSTGTNGLKDRAARGLVGGRGLEGSRDTNEDGMATFNWRGHQLRTMVMPYRFWLLQHLHDAAATAGNAEQENIREVFAAVGLETMLDLRTSRRVQRVNNLEVWGPVAAT